MQFYNRVPYQLKDLSYFQLVSTIPQFTVPPTFVETAVSIRIAPTAVEDHVHAGSSSLIVVPHVVIRIPDAVRQQTVSLILCPLAG